MISQHTIQSFQDAVREEQGIELSYKEAEKTLRALVQYTDKLAEVYHREQVSVG